MTKYFSFLIPSSREVSIRILILILSCLSIVFTQELSSTPGPPTHVAGDTVDGGTRKQVEYRANEALESIHDWTLRFGGEVHRCTQETTCYRSIREQFDPSRNDFKRNTYRASVASIDWTRLHADIVRTISNSMDWHKDAVEAIVKASELFSSNHTFDEKLRVDYVDVHRLHGIEDEQPNGYSSETSEPMDDNETLTETGSSEVRDQGGGSLNQETAQLDSKGQIISSSDSALSDFDLESSTAEPLGTPAPLIQASGTPMPDAEGEWQTPIRYLKLDKHPNFGDVLISTETSAVHVPVHIYPADPVVMNSIAWSEELTKVFRNNLVRNPKLTNQYFASPLGFMRLFPAQKWQIPRTDPDLYDARMRPWYVAGASSRKDVVILIDSSGSMTGSRRDIAKGVIFEILDTLTDNDHFLILKFSDIIQQVGVPSCAAMRVERKRSPIPLKNTVFQQSYLETNQSIDKNATDIDSLYLLPATGRNIRYVKSNFTISTSGIANFSNALITAFEVLKKYQDTETLGSQCNQAIMLITDGSPSDFEDIFNRYNYPNAPVRVFSYLIGREANDGAHTKMMACHNRGFYTHVINLAEVRETVQQYIPVMARPLVLNRTHPTTWTPAYGELTYQMLTDWIWESRRREKARAVLTGAGRSANGHYVQRPDIQVTNDDNEGGLIDITSQSGSDLDSLELDLEALDIFGYINNPDCFWETRRNDLMTTVVQPVYDQRNETKVVEKFLSKNTWVKKESIMRTANLLGIAAADMKINDIVALAPSHKLGSNGYAIMLTNNGLVMHHPDLRSVLEPFTSDPHEMNAHILKPFFSSLDLTQVEHILNAETDAHLLAMRREAVEGKTGWRELTTKRTLDCQRRVQSRKQIFYYKPLDQFPFSFIIAIPQPYGSHRVEAQVEVKNSTLPERLTTYFTTSEYDLWSVHPEYQYCDGPSNNTITTLLDMFQRIEEGKLDDIQWRPAESTRPPIFSPDKIMCDKSLIQSLVYDAVATFSFSENCGPPSLSTESSLVSMFGVRFSFVATRSGLTRVRHYNVEDLSAKKEALAFAKKHARASDETYYSRTVDYNMLINDTATLIQVPFNTHQKILNRLKQLELDHASNYDNGPQDEFGNLDIHIQRPNFKDMTLFEKLELLTNSSLHVIATQSIIANEGAQRAVAAVVGVFYDYASFALRLLNTTNAQFSEARTLKKPAHCYLSGSSGQECDDLRTIRCGHSDDTIDCLLIDNNGYIIFSEDLNSIGRHLNSYDSSIMSRLVDGGVYHEVNITDYQSICVRQEDKQTSSSASSSLTALSSIVHNLVGAISHLWVISMTFAGSFSRAVEGDQSAQLQQTQQSIMSLLPNKTHLRPCDRILTRYEVRPGVFNSDTPDYYKTKCGCQAWFVYEQVPKTNLIMLVVDTTHDCRSDCREQGISLSSVDDSLKTEYNIIGADEGKVCTMFERESRLYKKRLETCFTHHPEEEHIKLCGGSSKSSPIQGSLLILMILFSLLSMLT